MSEREAILHAVREALASTGIPSGEVALPDASRTGPNLTHEQMVGRFIEEVEAVSGRVHRVPDTPPLWGMVLHDYIHEPLVLLVHPFFLF